MIPGGDREDLLVLLGEEGDELLDLGTGADQAHLSLEHVPELWQLVELAGHEEVAERGQALILVLGQRGTGCVAPHLPELEHVEDPAAPADTPRAVEDRPGRVDEDQHGHDQPYGEGERRGQDGHREVEDAHGLDRGTRGHGLVGRGHQPATSGWLPVSLRNRPAEFSKSWTASSRWCRRPMSSQ